MQVVLSITSYQRQSMGEKAQQSFGESGGTFGRGAANQWVLADPDRIISSQHGQISFQNGCFYLTDLSTNGIFISDKLVAVGKGSSVALSHGEVIRFGEYEVSVSLPNEVPLVADRNLGGDPAQLPVEDSLNLASDFDILGSDNPEPQPIGALPPNIAASRDNAGISSPDFDPLGNLSDGQAHSQSPATADNFSVTTPGNLSDQGAQSNHTDALTDPFIAPQVSHQDSPQPPVQVPASLIGDRSQVDPFAPAGADTNQSSPHIPDDWDSTDFSVDSQAEKPIGSEPIHPSPITPPPKTASEQQPAAGFVHTPLDEPFANPIAPSSLPEHDASQEVDLAVPSNAQIDELKIQDNFSAPPIDDPYASPQPLVDPVAQKTSPSPSELAPTQQVPPPMHHLDQIDSDQGNSSSTETQARAAVASHSALPEEAQHSAEINQSAASRDHVAQPSNVTAASLTEASQVPRAAEATNRANTEPNTQYSDQQANDFMQALGVDAALLNGLDQAQVMREFGGLFREMLKGLIELQQARSLLKNEFRMSLTTIRPIENNPLKFAPNIDEALRIFLAHKGSGYLNADESIKESIAEIRNHQIAMISAMEAAFSQLMQRLSPEHFADSNNQSGVLKAAMQSLGKKSSAWQNYLDFYQDQVVDSGNAFQLLFGDAFVDAYEQQIKHISANKNSD